MIFLYHNHSVFIWGLSHQLGRQRRSLNELKAADLISNPVEALAKTGYENNFGAGLDENLLTLTAPPVTAALQQCVNPRAFVFHHSYAESASQPWNEGDADLMSRARYFPAALLKQINLDHVPYFGSFASGCTGFLSLLVTAAGLLENSDEAPVLCATADLKPSGVKFDGLKEKILTSDCSSAFVLGREQRGYQLLGINYYSTVRTLIPLVEIVKRTVQMIRDLAQKLSLDLAGGNVVVHYPNIFPDAWNMVSHYLKISPAQQILDGLAERAHCLSSDSVISLAKHHQGNQGRLHVVVNFGSGLHLGVCILQEEKNHVPGV